MMRNPDNLDRAVGKLRDHRDGLMEQARLQKEASWTASKFAYASVRAARKYNRDLVRLLQANRAHSWGRADNG
jgi:hypothetical protein